MSGAAWITVMTFATGIFLALLGIVYFAMEDCYYREKTSPSTTSVLVYGILYVGDLVAYAFLLVACFQMGPSMPHPLLVLFSMPIAGAGLLLVLGDKLFSS